MLGSPYCLWARSRGSRSPEPAEVARLQPVSLVALRSRQGPAWTAHSKAWSYLVITEEESEAQRMAETCPRSPSWKGLSQDSNAVCQSPGPVLGAAGQPFSDSSEWDPQRPARNAASSGLVRGGAMTLCGGRSFGCAGSYLRHAASLVATCGI